MKFGILFFLTTFAGLLSGHAKLVWDKPNQEFQRQPEDKELKVDFAFKNDGETPVTITKVSSSCGCTTADLPKKTFAAGESGVLTSIFSFGARRGEQSKIITVFTDDKKETKLSLKCLITADPVTLSPSYLFWRIGAPVRSQRVKVAASPNPEIQIVAVASANPRIVAKIKEVTPGREWEIEVRPEDTAKMEKAEIFVQTNYPTESPAAYTIHAIVK